MKKQRYEVREGKRAIATRFDLAQGSHQAVRIGRGTSRKAGTEGKTDSISNKELNSTSIE